MRERFSLFRGFDIKSNVLRRSMTQLLTLYFLDSGSYSKGYWNLWGIFQPTAYDWLRPVSKQILL